MNDRPIKAHLDEEMRAEIAFCLRRVRAEFQEMKVRAKPGRSDIIQGEIDHIEKCLKEIMEAGT